MPTYWTGLQPQPPEFNHTGYFSVTLSNGDIYILAGETATVNADAHRHGYLWRSTDDGDNWSRQSSTYFQSHAGATTVYMGLTMVTDGTDIWVLGSGPSDFYAGKWDVSSGAWSGTCQTYDPSDHYSTYAYQNSAVYDDSTHIAFLARADYKSMGSTYYRGAVYNFNPTTHAWDTGAPAICGEESQTVYISNIAMDANGDYHMLSWENPTWNHYKISGGTATGGEEVTGIKFQERVSIWAYDVDGTATLFATGLNTTREFIVTSTTGTTWGDFHYTSWDESGIWMDERGNMSAVLIDDDDTVYLCAVVPIYLSADSSYRYRVYQSSKTISGSWTEQGVVTTGEETADRWDNSENVSIWMLDSSTGTWAFIQAMFYANSTTNDGMVFDIAEAPDGYTKTHKTDAYLVLEGVVGNYYMPSTVTSSTPTMNYKWNAAMVTWGVKADDPKTLVGHAWTSANPDGENYERSTPTESFTFASNIVDYDWALYGTVVAIQLDDGSVHVGMHSMRSEARESTGSYYYWNEWTRDQERYTNATHLKPRLVASAPSTLPANWGVRIAPGASINGFYIDRNDYWVLFTGEPVGGVEKVYWADSLHHRSDDVWGGVAASVNPSPIDGMYHSPPQMVNPLNTTDDERPVGFVMHSGSFSTLGGSSALWTQEGASTTKVWQAHHARKPQPMWTDATSGSFTVKFPHTGAATESSSIAYNASAATVETALESMTEIEAATVTGSGIRSDPWLITTNTVYSGVGLPLYPNYFYEGTTNTLNGELVFGVFSPHELFEVKHGSIPKLNSYEMGDGHGTTGPRRYQNYKMLYAQTNGKVGIKINSKGKDRSSWSDYAVDASTTTVHLHNDVVQATLAVREMQVDTSVFKGYGWDMLLYVDDTTRDIKGAARSWEL